MHGINMAFPRLHLGSGRCVLGKYFLVVQDFAEDPPFCYSLSILKEKNGQIFNSTEQSVEEITVLVKVKVGRWVLRRKKFENFKLKNLEACMS